MRVNPEVAYNALFNQVCGINKNQANGHPSFTPLRTMSRRWVKWDEIGDLPMPAFFQMQPPTGANASQVGKFGITKWHLKAELWFYFAVDVGDLHTPTSTVINNYLAAVDLILQPTIQSPGGARQQLGLGPGLENAWIDGTVITDEGIFTPPAILMVPVTMTMGG